MKASSVVAPKKIPRIKPDLEDAIDESDEGEEILAEDETKEDESEELDLKKDRYVKVPKKTAAKKGGTGKATTKSKSKKGKKNNDIADDEKDALDSDEDDVKPKKGRRGRKPKGKTSQ
jgi:replication factor C subunit 1